MPILTFVTFCQRNTSETGQPGNSSRHLHLTHVRKEHDEKDPNGALFDGPNGNFNVAGNSVTAEVAAKFTTGKKYKITVDEID